MAPGVMRLVEELHNLHITAAVYILLMYNMYYVHVTGLEYTDNWQCTMVCFLPIYDYFPVW